MAKVMLYKKGGNQRIHGKLLKTKIVDEGEVEQMVASGWSRTTGDVDDEDKKLVVAHSPVVREALELCASGLGIISANLTNDDLAQAILDSGDDVEPQAKPVAAEEVKETQKATEEAEAKQETDAPEKTERELLEDRANSLGVEFRSNIGDDTLLERVEEAEANQE